MSSFNEQRASFGLVIVALLLLARPAVTSAVEPVPTLTPRQVVEVQLDALKLNPLSDDDAGIRKTFEFAAPANRAQTGPVDRFIRMVRGPTYAPLLGHAAADVEKMEISDTRAQFAVIVRGLDGSLAGYVWVVGKQADGAHAGCWMTEAVVRVPLEEAPPSELRI